MFLWSDSFFFLHCLYWQKASIALGEMGQSHCCSSPAVEFLLTATIPSMVRRHSIQPPHTSFSPLSTLFSVFISIQFTMKTTTKKKATSFVLIFLFLYNFMVIKFNLMWKNEDRETGLPAYLFQQKTRTRQFPVKIQAERAGKRKRPSVCGPTPEGRDYKGSRACWGWVLTTGPGLPPTSPKDTENGLSIWNWQ